LPPSRRRSPSRSREGPGGRIVRKDVEAAASAAPEGARAGARPQFRPVDVTGPEFEDQPLSQMRAIIAKRMPLSKAPVPHFYVSSEVAMDRAWELREELNGLEGQPKISVNDLVCARVRSRCSSIPA
jgi:pyruvate dehydrogenase E2 component (dihydrolipoamide acetyltransferase)